MILRLYILCILTLTLYNSSAQDYIYSVKQWEVEDGLQHREVNTILEDNRGLIWIGTTKGVQRYDGHEFKSWDRSNGGRKMHAITKMGQDDGDWLWLWNKDFNEFLFLNTITDEILSEEERFGDSFLIRSFNREGTWLYNEDRLAKNDKNQLVFVISKPNRVVLFNTKNGFQHKNLPEFNGGQLALKKISSNGELIIQENLKDETRFIHVLSKEYLVKSTNEIFHTNSEIDVHDNQGTIFISNKESDKLVISLLNADGQLVKQEKLTTSATNRTFIGSLFWEHTMKGWTVRDRDQKEVFRIPYGVYKKSLDLTSNDIFEDSKGRVWMASYFGLSALSVSSNQFGNLMTKPPFSQGNFSSRGIAEAHGKIYVTLENSGVYEVSKNKEPKKIFGERGYGGTSLYQYSEDTLLLGHNNNITIYNLVEQKVKNTITLPSEQFVWSITRLGDKILIGTIDTIYSLDIKSGTVKPFNTQRYRDTYQIIEIDNLYYAATSKGLQIVKKDGTVQQTFNEQQDNENYLPLNTCFSIYQDGPSLWLGTDQGLIKWNTNTKLYTSIGQKDGLSNNTVYTIESDDFDRLWLGTDFGLCVYTISQNTIQTFTTKNGITENEFNRISSFKDSEGKLYLGTLNGITTIDPKKVKTSNNESNASIILTSFLLFDNEKGTLISKMNEALLADKIVITPSYKYIQIKCASPDYLDDDLAKYEWRLSGLDSTWQPMSNNSLQLGKIPYGLNILEVRGKKNGSNSTTKPLILKLNALKPFYLRTWFLFLITAMALGIGLGYVRYKTLQFRKNQEILQQKITQATATIAKDKAIIEKNADRLRELDQVKTRFFTNVSHELRTPLTLILGPLERILADSQNAIPERFKSMISLSFNNSKKLKNRVDELLNLSKLDSGKLTLRTTPANLVSIFRETINSFEPVANDKNITLAINTHIAEDTIVLIDYHKVVKVIDNLMSNALKHSPSKSTILATLDSTDTHYTIQVSDSGNGVPKEEQQNIFDRFYQTTDGDAVGGTGIGLSYSRGLAKLMGGDLTIDQSYTNGASFLFSFSAEKVSNAEEHQTNQNTSVNLPLWNLGEKLPYSLLIVEDTDEMRQYIRSIVEPLYTVYEASDGLEALKLLELKKIDIILSDIMMPNLDGLGLIKEIKKREKLKNIPFIFLSAKSDKSQVTSALEMGIDDYITKPFYSRELLARLQNLTQNLTTRLANSTNQEPTNSHEKTWINKLKEYVLDNVSNTNFGVAEVVSYMATTERTLNRKLNASVGFSCAAFIKEARLQKAIELLQADQNISIKEISAKVGYKRQDYFAREFYKRFGKQPSEYL